MNEQDWDDLQRLLHLAEQGRLTKEREQRLRYIVWLTNPEAFRLDLGEVLRRGYVVLGVHLIEQETLALGHPM